MKKIALLILAATTALPLSALAAEATLTTDIQSAYVFRGQVGNDEAVFQPGLEVTGPVGLAYTLWANMNLTDVKSAWSPDSAGKWGEVNLGLAWTLPWEGPVSLTLGGTYFLYPQDSSEIYEDDNGENQVTKAPADNGYDLYVELAATACPLNINPSLRFSHNLAHSEDWILLMGIAPTFSLTDALTLDLGAVAGYAGRDYLAAYFESDTGAAFTYAQLDASLTYAFCEKFSMSLKGSFSTLIDSQLRDDVKASDIYPKTEIFFGGISASYTF